MHVVPINSFPAKRKRQLTSISLKSCLLNDFEIHAEKANSEENRPKGWAQYYFAPHRKCILALPSMAIKDTISRGWITENFGTLPLSHLSEDKDRISSDLLRYWILDDGKKNDSKNKKDLVIKVRSLLVALPSVAFKDHAFARCRLLGSDPGQNGPETW